MCGLEASPGASTNLEQWIQTVDPRPVLGHHSVTIYHSVQVIFWFTLGPALWDGVQTRSLSSF